MTGAANPREEVISLVNFSDFVFDPGVFLPQIVNPN